jgi:hypothetical protein
LKHPANNRVAEREEHAASRSDVRAILWGRSSPSQRRYRGLKLTVTVTIPSYGIGV